MILYLVKIASFKLFVVAETIDIHVSPTWTSKKHQFLCIYVALFSNSRISHGKVILIISLSMLGNHCFFKKVCHITRLKLLIHYYPILGTMLREVNEVSVQLARVLVLTFITKEYWLFKNRYIHRKLTEGKSIFWRYRKISFSICTILS